MSKLLLLIAALAAAMAAALVAEDLRIPLSGGQSMHVVFHHPVGRSLPPTRSPAVVYVIPWGGAANGMRGIGIQDPDLLVRKGIAIALFDFPGTENNPSPDAVKDKYGPERQQQLKELLDYVATRPDVDPAGVGLISFSSGNILAAGALHRGAKVKFWIDAEGPTNRHVLMLNIPGTMAAVPPFPSEDKQGEWMSRQFVGASLNDEAYWAEREAFRLMQNLRCRYLRLQGELDHVHNWYYGHAIHALNTALNAGSPWVRGGDGPVNIRHTDRDTIGLLPGRLAQNPARVIRFIEEMVFDAPAAPVNPMLISLVIHVEEGSQVSAGRYRQVAGGLRALCRVFSRHNARINLDVEPGFVTAIEQARDSLLTELEQCNFAIGGFPHGALSRDTLNAIRASGATPVYLFGHWGRGNSNWVEDAIANGIDVTLGFFSILMPDVTPGSVFDHETVPYNRADRVHPWRIASTAAFLKHDPAGKLIYIPGDSIDELEKLHERQMTGLWNRPLDRIDPPPSLDDRDFQVATEYLRRQLAFAKSDRVNTWYIAVNSKKVRDFAAATPMFERWLAAIDHDFVRTGAIRWANAREVRLAYLDWEKRR